MNRTRDDLREIIMLNEDVLTERYGDVLSPSSLAGLVAIHRLYDPALGTLAVADQEDDLFRESLGREGLEALRETKDANVQLLAELERVADRILPDPEEER